MELLELFFTRITIEKIFIIISIYFWNLSNPQNGKSLLRYQCQILSAVIVSALQQISSLRFYLYIPRIQLKT